MATVTTFQRIDRGAIALIMISPQRGVVQDLMRRGLRVESQAKRNISGQGGTGPKRVDTGRARSSITTVLVSRSGKPAVVIGSNLEYIVFLHDGTGIYGPRKKPIRPISHQFLRFKPKGARGYVYVKQVKGMRPNPFLKRALSAAKD